MQLEAPADPEYCPMDRYVKFTQLNTRCIIMHCVIAKYRDQRIVPTGHGVQIEAPDPEYCPVDRYETFTQLKPR